MKAPLSQALLAAALLAGPVLGQIALPPHSSVYNGFTRGFNFTANANFLITQLDLPPEAFQTGDTAGYMVRVNGVEVLRSVGNAGAISTSIVINPGDVVDILGNWSPATTTNFTAHNSYGAGPFNTTIVGVPHVIQRTGWQWDIGDSAYLTGGYLAPGSGSLGRVLMWATPPSGLFPNFNATPTSGASPLQVQFTDATFTSDPNGVTAWAWDFDNDGNVDSTVQSPLHTYTVGGRYTVSLRATDGTHGSVTETKRDLIVVDPVDADFTATPAAGVAPLQVQFTDTSTGSPIAWNWDFDSDGTVDSTAQNPLHTYTAGGVYTVTLAVTNGANQDTEIKTDLIRALGATNNTQSPEILEYQFNEPRGTAAANTAATTAAPSHATVTVPTWQVDPGRTFWQGNDPGYGAVAANNASPYTAIDTGWPVDISGSHTISFWTRPQGTVGTCYPFGMTGGGSGRCYYISSLSGFSLRSWGQVPTTDAGTSPNAVTGWNHWAVVIDDASGTAQWYLNGVADGTQTTFTPGTFAYAPGGRLLIGTYSTLTSTSNYLRYADLDDFRIYSRALTPAQILQSMLFESPVTSTFGDGCTGPGAVPQLGASGGAPSIAGNAAFALEARGMEPGRPAAINLGLAQTSNPFLPYDLTIVGPTLAGCFAEVFPDITAIGIVNAGGSATAALAIPADPSLASFHFYCQLVVLGTQGAVSPALDINFK